MVSCKGPSISVNSLSITQNVLPNLSKLPIGKDIPFNFGSAHACAIPLATLTGEFIGNSPNISFAASPAKLVSIIS
jgi:hypothetical protein